jgi:hypothetical protein
MWPIILWPVVQVSGALGHTPSTHAGGSSAGGCMPAVHQDMALRAACGLDHVGHYCVCFDLVAAADLLLSCSVR